MKRNRTKKIKATAVNPLEGLAVHLKGMKKIDASTVGQLQQSLVGVVGLLVNRTFECPDEITKYTLVMKLVCQVLDQNIGAVPLRQEINPLESLKPLTNSLN